MPVAIGRRNKSFGLTKDNKLSMAVVFTFVLVKEKICVVFTDMKT